MHIHVEFRDLSEDVQKEVLDCAEETGINIEKIMHWINAGIAAAESMGAEKMEVCIE